MPRLTVHSVESAPEDSKETLAALAKSIGKVLNIHGEMAAVPVVLHAYAALKEALADYGTFDAKAEETVALAVGGLNQCAYCQGAHTMSGKAAGLSPDDMLAIRAGKPVEDAKTASLAALARAYVSEVGHVPDQLWQDALDAGWTTEQLGELSVHVTINQLTNHFNHYVGTELDVPEAPPLS